MEHAERGLGVEGQGCQGQGERSRHTWQVATPPLDTAARSPSTQARFTPSANTHATRVRRPPDRYMSRVAVRRPPSTPLARICCARSGESLISQWALYFWPSSYLRYGPGGGRDAVRRGAMWCDVVGGCTGPHAAACHVAPCHRRAQHSTPQHATAQHSTALHPHPPQHLQVLLVGHGQVGQRCHPLLQAGYHGVVALENKHARAEGRQAGRQVGRQA